ncbi:helix-turn-helix transcriptional regulator [Lactiplantibacillus paraplantarum]|uniref:Cro/Cl family transcriptional regulator n=1 Tax=Lactiplantibacillus paraplantarum TaxID=60520 RepID=A0ABQ0NAD3_9LACO|nr:helix-turn-helix transcriptional regulator [Lactiplantibacillus paraplantarum]ERL45570.1 transcription regulator [Lactiplantibacillus paraplantarum]MCU4682951.1 helix-turn-helix domain-containing protein [Lactiplantibacillus paraplantarum]MDL2061776.1 helix-turn-helix transcriptional regulator [Lactiplantibacillus paraplantarum]UKB42389.1 helix-turn-helix domain-containing protein [Lactiplantibacillus paraplantarum]GBF02036.1 Cro/Cl family transcriptional regulator [Lactiplantibacillus para
MKIVIGTKVKEQRQQHEWSQQMVAEQLHVSRQTISKWELGKVIQI